MWNVFIIINIILVRTMMLSTFMLYWLLFIYLFFLGNSSQVRSSVNMYVVTVLPAAALWSTLHFFGLLSSIMLLHFFAPPLLPAGQQTIRLVTLPRAFGLQLRPFSFLFFSLSSAQQSLWNAVKLTDVLQKSLRMDLFVNWDQLARFNFNSNQIRFVGGSGSW